MRPTVGSGPATRLQQACNIGGLILVSTELFKPSENPMQIRFIPAVLLASLCCFSFLSPSAAEASEAPRSSRNADDLRVDSRRGGHWLDLKSYDEIDEIHDAVFEFAFDPIDGAPLELDEEAFGPGLILGSTSDGEEFSLELDVVNIISPEELDLEPETYLALLDSGVTIADVRGLLETDLGSIRIDGLTFAGTLPDEGFRSVLHLVGIDEPHDTGTPRSAGPVSPSGSVSAGLVSAARPLLRASSRPLSDCAQRAMDERNRTVAEAHADYDECVALAQATRAAAEAAAADERQHSLRLAKIGLVAGLLGCTALLAGWWTSILAPSCFGLVYATYRGLKDSIESSYRAAMRAAFAAYKAAQRQCATNRDNHIRDAETELRVTLGHCLALSR